ncbi:MAG: hypothetical protein ACE14M_01755 [Terriglobales bacterium]
MENALLVCVVAFVVAFITTRLTVISIYRKMEQEGKQVQEDLLASARAEADTESIPEAVTPAETSTSEPAEAFSKAAGR